MGFLQIPTPPRLPDPESDYSPRWTAAVLQVLRLYFTQLHAFMSAIAGRDGGQFIEMPTASYYADTNQAFPLAVATPIELPLLTNEQGFSKPSLSKMSPDYSGTYRFSIRLTLRNTHAPDEKVNFWVRKNATDIPTTMVEASVPSNGILSVSTEFIIDLVPTDTVEFMIYATSAFMGLYAPPAVGPVPRGVAARVSINLVSSDSRAPVTSALFRVKKTILDPAP
jgi:hypothetical protein